MILGTAQLQTPFLPFPVIILILLSVKLKLASADFKFISSLLIERKINILRKNVDKTLLRIMTAMTDSFTVPANFLLKLMIKFLESYPVFSFGGGGILVVWCGV
jgi:hypothetical protein